SGLQPAEPADAVGGLRLLLHQPPGLQLPGGLRGDAEARHGRQVLGVAAATCAFGPAHLRRRDEWLHLDGALWRPWHVGAAELDAVGLRVLAVVRHPLGDVALPRGGGGRGERPRRLGGELRAVGADAGPAGRSGPEGRIAARTDGGWLGAHYRFGPERLAALLQTVVSGFSPTSADVFCGIVDSPR
ncbi:unnamed protein product, partial [Effrenium voratum]